jgi:hypothetical protein
MFLVANIASFGRMVSRQLIHTANTARFGSNTARFGSHEWFIKCEMYMFSGSALTHFLHLCETTIQVPVVYWHKFNLRCGHLPFQTLFSLWYEVSWNCKIAVFLFSLTQQELLNTHLQQHTASKAIAV